ncbi:hypothetical protein GCM10011348_12290 [Marinobacterium nitratireducens]|uniref:Uncharacterized protein n=1 Tax=Marinobacterium nitratireducens TaxID=518897 RepID=A0A917Z9M8_9GAMM|nr:hypothetical protein [Marinobacterium nitratireducens]GGO79022.1 hypothetical protein GCM10011348_12290 [Marinobacterium nitratireducens]
MSLCPIAIAVGCKGCPAYAVCPLKGVIGDYKADAAKTSDRKPQEEAPADKESKPRQED